MANRKLASVQFRIEYIPCQSMRSSVPRKVQFIFKIMAFHSALSTKHESSSLPSPSLALFLALSCSVVLVRRSPLFALRLHASMFGYVSFAFLVTRDPFGMTSAADCRYVMENIPTETTTGNTAMLTACAVNTSRATSILSHSAPLCLNAKRWKSLRTSDYTPKLNKLKSAESILHIFVLELQQKRAKNVSTSAALNRI